MKKIFFFFVFFFVIASFMSLQAQWAITFGGAASDVATCILQTSDGGYVIAGYTSSFSGSTDYWVMKIDSEFQSQWQRTYGGVGNDYLHSIQETSDGGYIVAGQAGPGSFGNGGDEAWLLKLDSTGGVDWQRYYSGIHHDYAYSAQQTSDGGFLVAGHSNSFSIGGDYDIWVLKLNSDGTVNWHQTSGGTGDEYCRSMQVTSDGGCVLAGYTTSFGLGAHDFWILKLSSSGTVQWQFTYGGANDDQAWAIQQTSDGGYIVAGQSSSFNVGIDNDIWIIKLDPLGTPIWQHTFGGILEDRARSIRETSDGDFVITGYTESFGAGNNDVWVLNLDSMGTPIWQNAYGGSSDDAGICVQETSEGGYVVAGQVSSHLPAVNNDFLILKLYPNGVVETSCGITETSYATLSGTGVAAIGTFVAPQSVTATFSSNPTGQAAGSTSENAYIWCEAPKVTLTTAVSPVNGGSIDPPPGIHYYYVNSEETVTADANINYTFDGWSGDASGTTNPLDVTLDSNKSITANFRARPTGDGGNGTNPEGGLCFIATAAFGSPSHFYVKVLRDFRDEYLMSSKTGRRFVLLYYEYSPRIAGYIEKHSLLRVAVRIHLLPLVVLSYMLLHLGAGPTAVMLLLMCMIPIFTVRMRRRR